MAGSLRNAEPAADVRILRATGRQIPAAARLLAPGNEPDAGARIVQALASHGIDASHLWASSLGPSSRFRQACLAVPGAGRSAMVFTSAPATPSDASELAMVISAALGGLRDIDIAQALLESHESGARRAFLHAGFLEIGKLTYLRRPTPRPGELAGSARTLPEGLHLRCYRTSDDPALIRALDASYIGTQDCPELCGLRRTRDVLESHRAAGRWDPACWWILESGEEIGGMVLLNPCPESGSIELVYMGLAPAFRGRGLGSTLLVRALAGVAGRAEPLVTCAVDNRNAPAIRLYGRLGFEAFGERLALVRSVRRAVENAPLSA
jgi:GNAT superfamily N-acetyltransferase